jgi:hypothetical protein
MYGEIVGLELIKTALHCEHFRLLMHYKFVHRCDKFYECLVSVMNICGFLQESCLCHCKILVFEKRLYLLLHFTPRAWCMKKGCSFHCKVLLFERSFLLP